MDKPAAVERYWVEHETRYAYTAPVSQSWQLARLTPRCLPWQRLTDFTLEIEPKPDERRDEEDSFGNTVTHFGLHAAHRMLRVRMQCRVEVLPRPSAVGPDNAGVEPVTAAPPAPPSGRADREVPAVGAGSSVPVGDDPSAARATALAATAETAASAVNAGADADAVGAAHAVNAAAPASPANAADAPAPANAATVTGDTSDTSAASATDAPAVSVAPIERLASSASTPARSLAWESVRDAVRRHPGAPEHLQAARMSEATPLVPLSEAARAYAVASFPRGRDWYEAVFELMRRIYRDFEFQPGATTVSTSVDEVLHQRSGVCQDFAHLMLAGLRGLGLPARYVSGYLLTEPPPGQPRLMGVDASHAWVAAFSPNHGWVEFDPTNDQLADQRYITLGWGADFADVVPLRGVILGGGDQRMAVEVSVIPQG